MIHRVAGRVALASAVVMAAAGCEWTQFRSDAAHTGNIAELTLGTGNVADLEQLWSVEHDLALPGTVTTDDAVVVVADAEARAYEAATGALRWQVPLPLVADLHREWARPSSHDGVVYIGYTDPLFSWGVHGGFLQIDAATGADALTSSQGAVRSTATFAGDEVWYGYGEVAPMAQGVFQGIEGRLPDGRRVRTVEHGTLGTPGAPAVADGVVYASRVAGGFLDAFDAAAQENCSDVGAYRVCTPLWSAPVTGGAAPAVSGSTVFASTGSGVAAYATGVRGPDQQPLWQADVAGASHVALDPAASATQVFVGSSDGSLKVFPAVGCAPATTCAPSWQGLTGGAVSGPAVANGVVYVGSGDGFVHAFAAAGCGAATCAPLWSAPTPGAPAEVVVADGRVIVLTTTGDLVAFGMG